ncbi:galactose mutarotase [Saprospiraceae bacterium]|nr:galactose mutarotase [Saprospiraceae bacterium]
MPKIVSLTLSNSKHAIQLTNVGASLMSWKVISKNQKEIDVILGFSRAGDYLKDHPFFGSVVGRYANRIAEGKFELNGTAYDLELNNKGNHLHGGSRNFGTRIWEVKSQNEYQVIFSLESENLDANYPGNLSIEVKYTLSSKGELHIECEAICDKDTICNLTNHAYFNLSGESHGEIFDDHEFQIKASHFLPIDETSIPTGVYQSVENTLMDFRNQRKIDKSTLYKAPYFELTRAYDHNFVLGRNRKMRHAANVKSVTSGIMLDCYTDKPGMQFYLACFLEGFKSKQGIEYVPFGAFCLEAQFFPDSPNKNYFPSSILRAHETYRQHTIYKLSPGSN